MCSVIVCCVAIEFYCITQTPLLVAVVYVLNINDADVLARELQARPFKFRAQHWQIKVTDVVADQVTAANDLENLFANGFELRLTSDMTISNPVHFRSVAWNFYF